MTGNAYAAQHASHSVTLAALLVVTLQVSDPLKDEVCGCCGCLQLSSSLHSDGEGGGGWSWWAMSYCPVPLAAVASPGITSDLLEDKA